MAPPAAAPFLRDPITVSRTELIEHYHAQAARYHALAERQNRSSIYKGLIHLARQCAAMADALASPNADQGAKVTEAEILVLLDEVKTGEKSELSVPVPKPSQSASLAAVPLRELSLDEILQKVQRDIAEGGPAAN